jgi:hypothetical protein
MNLQIARQGRRNGLSEGPDFHMASLGTARKGHSKVNTVLVG